jgi:hypothetical protein
MPDLEINPKGVALTAGQTQKFEALEGGVPAQGVTWSIQTSGKPEKPENVGTIDSSGAYTAPSRIFLNRKVTILARTAGGASATAQLELTPLQSWRIQFTGAYLLISFLFLLGYLVLNWEDLCPTCKPCNVRVSPPVVTLMPGQSQAFTANMPVTWKNGDISIPALYTAPMEPSGSKTQVSASAGKDNAKTGTAEVFFSPTGGLSLQPLHAVIRGGGSVDFTAILTSAPPPPPPPPVQASAGTAQGQASAGAGQGQTTAGAPQGQASAGAGQGQTTAGAPRENGTTSASPPSVVLDWMSPETGTLKALETENGGDGLIARFSVADKAVDRPTTFMILARTRGETPARVAGAWVTVQPQDMLTGMCGDDSEYKTGSLLLLLAIMGALGGLIHGISSFTTFVGNREFLPSWAWWYVFKPFLAALVALVVFLVFRAGFGMGDFSLDTADCLKAAAFAALIGLFAEQATIKLKDIFEAFFTPRRDPRDDKAGNVKPKTPAITSLDPTSVTAGKEGQPLTINGTDFSPECQVKIGGAAPRKPDAAPTPTQLVVTLQKADVEKPGTVEVIVFNKPPDGDPSNKKTFEVKAAT